MGKRGRIYNTFDAHRLLHWAEGQGPGQQRALKEKLFEAYFTQGDNPSDRDVLVRVAGEAGLDPEQARTVLDADAYADDVRQQRILLAARRHPLGAGDHHQRASPDFRRPAARGVRAGLRQLAQQEETTAAA